MDTVLSTLRSRAPLRVRLAVMLGALNAIATQSPRVRAGVAPGSASRVVMPSGAVMRVYPRKDETRKRCEARLLSRGMRRRPDLTLYSG